jgi:hypothetical protein
VCSGDNPEGYLEGFASLYTDFADRLMAHINGTAPDPASLLVPGVIEGLKGMKFVEAVIRSGREGVVGIKM